MAGGLTEDELTQRGLEIIFMIEKMGLIWLPGIINRGLLFLITC